MYIINICIISSYVIQYLCINCWGMGRGFFSEQDFYKALIADCFLMEKANRLKMTGSGKSEQAGISRLA